MGFPRGVACSLAFALLALCHCDEAPASLSLSKNGVTPEEEAQQIVLDSTRELLPEPELVSKIQTIVAAIRSQQPIVANVSNDGRWKLGEVYIQNYTTEIFQQIKKSEYAPLKEINQETDTEATVIFVKPYNPDLLAKKLTELLGVKVSGVWKKKQPDYGSIIYKALDNTFTFRQGLANCSPTCKDNRFWVFKVDSDNNSTLHSEYASSVPFTFRKTKPKSQ